MQVYTKCVLSTIEHEPNINEPRLEKSSMWLCARRLIRSAKDHSDLNIRCSHVDSLDLKLPT